MIRVIRQKWIWESHHISLMMYSFKVNIYKCTEVMSNVNVKALNTKRSVIWALFG